MCGVVYEAVCACSSWQVSMLIDPPIFDMFCTTRHLMNA